MKSKTCAKTASGTTFLTALFFLLFFLCPSVMGQDKKDLPERAISVFPEYTGIVIPQGEAVDMDLIVVNGGRAGENINVSLSAIPSGWKAWIKTYKYGVTGLHVRSDDSKSLLVRLQPEKSVEQGEYLFDIQAETADGKLESNSRIRVTVTKGKEEKSPEGVNITTSYPMLTGPTDARFEFSVEVENKSDQEGLFNLTAQGPENWTMNFKPAYEDKFISSLRLKAGQSQTVAFEVKPNPWASPGQYPLLVRINSATAEGEAALNVVLTGVYALEAGTANGLLSLGAVRGEPATLSFYVKNTGSAVLSNVRLLSFQPENWKVTFTPDVIETLPPQELKQVEVSITPSSQALVGDYSVGLRAESGSPPRAEKTIELRTNVTASAAWGWTGIGIIVFVIAGLVALFIRLGRR